MNKRKKTRIVGLPYPSDIGDLATKGNLGSYEILLLHELRAAMNSKNRMCWRAQYTLSKRMGCSIDSVKRAVRSLREKGYIQIKKRGKGNLYRLIFDKNGNWAEGHLKKEMPQSDSGQQLDKDSAEPLNSETKSYEHLGQVAFSSSNKTRRVKQSKRMKSSSIPKNEEDLILFYRYDDKKNNASPSTEDLTGRAEKEFDTGNRDLNIINDESCDKAGGTDKSQDSTGKYLSEADIAKFYGSKNIPPSVHLNKRRYHGRGKDRYDLQKYIWPFTGYKKDLMETCGTDYSGPPPFETWEEQFDIYYDQVIERHWDPYSNSPGQGFKKAFRRAAIAGVLWRCGFRPVTPEQKRKLKIEEKRQREIAEKEREILMKEKEIKRKRFEHKLQKASELRGQLPEGYRLALDKEYYHVSPDERDRFLIDQIPHMKKVIAENLNTK